MFKCNPLPVCVKPLRVWGYSLTQKFKGQRFKSSNGCVQSSKASPIMDLKCRFNNTHSNYSSDIRHPTPNILLFNIPRSTILCILNTNAGLYQSIAQTVACSPVLIGTGFTAQIKDNIHQVADYLVAGLRIIFR